MKTFLAAACVAGVLLATPHAGVAQNQWFNPDRHPTYTPPQPLPPGTPVYYWTKSDTLACPSGRDLIYFYRSGLDFGDHSAIEAWITAHGCEVLPWGKKYLAIGYTAPVTALAVAEARMYVRTDAVLGPLSDSTLSRDIGLGILRANPEEP